MLTVDIVRAALGKLDYLVTQIQEAATQGSKRIPNKRSVERILDGDRSCLTPDLSGLASSIFQAQQELLGQEKRLKKDLGLDTKIDPFQENKDVYGLLTTEEIIKLISVLHRLNETEIAHFVCKEPLPNPKLLSLCIEIGSRNLLVDYLVEILAERAKQNSYP